MPKKQKKNLVVSLDIGTSKVVALIGELDSEGHIEIIGVASHPSTGLRRGVVVNIEATIESIRRAIDDAERMADCQIHSAYVGVSGKHIRSLNSHGIVAIRDGEVRQSDIDRVIDAAKAVAIPSDRQILHILPQEFIVDNQQGVREPVGMSGVRLEAKVHIVNAAVSAVQNITKCVKRCGLQVGDMVLQQLASSHAVLNDDEKELGVCLIDIGGGTTDIAIFVNGAIRYTSIIPIAGDHVTNDIAVALCTPTQSAEAIKIESASVLHAEGDALTRIEIPRPSHTENQKVNKSALVDVVNARYQELFELIKAHVESSGFKKSMTAGYVLTGGAVKAPGLLNLAHKVFDSPVRLGVPSHVTGLEGVCDDPSYATAVGLLIHGAENQSTSMPGIRLYPCAEGLLTKMRTWFQVNF